MKKSRIFWAICLLLYALPIHAETFNSCVACHESPLSPRLRQYHGEWEVSIHAQQGIRCEQCHGGDGATADKDASHRGVYPSMDPRSPVYYSKVPGLCGSCHVQALADFKTSGHYRNLMETGTGPNCVTCHDAMSTKVLSPAKVEMFCTLCHNPRSRSLPAVGPLAKGVLHQMAETKRRLVQARATVRSVAQRGVATERAEQLLAAAATELSGCRNNWHTFRLAGLEVRLEAVDHLVSKSLRALNQTDNDLE